MKYFDSQTLQLLDWPEIVTLFSKAYYYERRYESDEEKFSVSKKALSYLIEEQSRLQFLVDNVSFADCLRSCLVKGLSKIDLQKISIKLEKGGVLDFAEINHLLVHGEVLLEIESLQDWKRK